MSKGESNLHDQQVDQAIGSFLVACDKGENPNPQVWFHRYPHLIAELNEFFAAEQHLGDVLIAPADFPTEAFVPSTGSLGGPAVDESLGTSEASQTWAMREPIVAGAIFAGKYRVFDVKKGGMGIVYLAELIDSHRCVAIKSVCELNDWKKFHTKLSHQQALAQYRACLERFRREALTWVRLGWHDHVVLACEVLDVGAKPYLVIDYVDGGDLASWIAGGRMTVPLAINLAIQFCRGMRHAATAAGLVHRDIKPANILLTKDGLLKIADFGLARAFDAIDVCDGAAKQSGNERTLSEAGAGTRPYMPPEQFVSLASADIRSDIFSFGATLHEMLTGERLFGIRDSFQMALSGRPVILARQKCPNAPQSLWSMIERCLQFDPLDRYATFADLEADLLRTDEAHPNRLPIPADPRPMPAELNSLPIRLLAEIHTLIQVGNFAQAIEKADEAIALNPREGEYWSNKAKALGELQRFEESRFCARRAVRLRPQDAAAWSNIGWTHLMLGDYESGMEATRTATRLDAGFSDGWLCRGCCAHRLGDEAEAQRSLERAIELAPHEWKAHANLGFFLEDLKRFGEAEFALRQAVAINPANAEVWYHLACVRGQLIFLTPAIQAIEHCLELAPDNAEAWAFRGLLALMQSGNRDAARSYLDKATRLNPESDKVIMLSQTLGF